MLTDLNQMLVKFYTLIIPLQHQHQMVTILTEPHGGKLRVEQVRLLELTLTDVNLKKENKYKKNPSPSWGVFYFYI
jgi:hypothetical protein